MLTCPMCKKRLASLERECPTCKADLSLLIDYVDHLGEGLVRAADLTRKGQLAEAVWAYLEVLEVDPDNPVARRQVGQVVAAVRYFDRSTPLPQRWLQAIRRRAAQRRASENPSAPGEARLRGWFWVLLVLLALGLGFVFGQNQIALPGSPSAPEQVEP